jgi:hypothetical protein
MGLVKIRLYNVPIKGRTTRRYQWILRQQVDTRKKQLETFLACPHGHTSWIRGEANLIVPRF